MSLQSPPQSHQNYSPYSIHLGLTYVKRGQGWSEWQLAMSETLTNSNGVVHGGAIYSLADTCMGSALHTDLVSGETCTTVEIKISYFKAVQTGPLICRAKILNRGRWVVTLEAEIKDGERLVAKALGTFYVLKKD